MIYRCCGADCYAEDMYEPEPCWGDVECIDEIYSDDDYTWIHACEGHKPKWEGEKYLPEPTKAS